MIKPKSYLCFGLGIFGAIAMGIGCAQENHDAKVHATDHTPVESAEPEEINVEIVMKDEHEAEAGAASMEAPAPSINTTPNAVPSTCTDPTQCSVAPDATRLASGYPAAPGVGPAAPGLGYPGIGGPGPVGVGLPGGPGLIGDVPFGPGAPGPLYGLGYPFYVNDLIIVDDDNHRRRRDNDDDNTNDDDDTNNDDDDVAAAL